MADTDTNETKPAAEAQPGDLAAQLAAAKQEAAAHYDRYLRIAADLENYRRRAAREKEEVRQFGASRLLEDFLPVLDNLSRALAAARQPEADLKSLLGGLDLVLQQLKTTLASHGVTEIDPSGQAFNPHKQEAISHEPSAEVPAEHVLRVVRPGYALNGRLIRPATVILSGGPAPAAKSG